MKNLSTINNLQVNKNVNNFNNNISNQNIENNFYQFNPDSYSGICMNSTYDPYYFNSNIQNDPYGGNMYKPSPYYNYDVKNPKN